MRKLDQTHDPKVRSWVGSADGHPEFPIQNLPLGIVDDLGRSTMATAIGDEILLLPQAVAAGWGTGFSPALKIALESDTLNSLADLPPAQWSELRLALFQALADPSQQEVLGHALRPRREAVMQLPFKVGDYTDFYASIHHATNVGALFRPDNPLLPNYKWIPIGYHGRASSLLLDGEAIRRPSGQLKTPDADTPTVGPSRLLDYELELGFFLGGENRIGEPVLAADAADRIFGVVLLNDWSARDIQSWEYQPLGPFLAKSFATTISPWVITADALRPFIAAMPERPEGDPSPLPYLNHPAASTTWSIDLEVLMCTEMMRSEGRSQSLAKVNYAAAMYWSPAQMLTHHASNGCNLRSGDLLGSGTISGTTPDSLGSLLEKTRRGKDILHLGTERRTFLEDGDEITLQGFCHAPGLISIGFGSCTGRVVPGD